jgi:hypothetical protein
MKTNPGQNPMRKTPDWRTVLRLAHASPRCGARTRAATPCKGPAMASGRCRMHGGASTGPRTPEGLQRIVRARTIHGSYSADNRQVAAMIRVLNARAKRLVELT